MDTTILEEIEEIEKRANAYRYCRNMNASVRVQKQKYSEWQSITQEFFLKHFGDNDENYKKIKQWTADKYLFIISDCFDQFQSICTEVFYQMRNPQASTPKKQSIPNGSKKVFLVHGHDKSMRDNVKKYIKELGLEPIVLSERANKNKTILEKLRTEAKDVGFAVVLYTPCDEGREAKSNAELEYRARENVVLELGYFSAQLGEKLAVLLKMPKDNRKFDFPNDYKSIGYIKYKGKWRDELKREFQEAGLAIVEIKKANKKTKQISLEWIDNAIIQYLKDNPQSQCSDIAKSIGTKYLLVRQSVKKLLNLGVLQQIGHPRCGYWKVCKE